MRSSGCGTRHRFALFSGAATFHALFDDDRSRRWPCLRGRDVARFILDTKIPRV
jgi:hypothetical protein